MKDKKLANEMIKSLGIENIKKNHLENYQGATTKSIVSKSTLCN